MCIAIIVFILILLFLTIVILEMCDTLLRFILISLRSLSVFFVRIAYTEIFKFQETCNFFILKNFWFLILIFFINIQLY